MSREISAFLSHFLVRPPLGAVQRLVYLGATKGLFDASVVLLLVTACTSSAIAMILGHLTDLGFYQGQRWAVFAGPVMLLGVSLFSAVSSVSSMVVMARMSQNVLVTLRTRFFLGLRSIRCFL